MGGSSKRTRFSDTQMSVGISMVAGGRLEALLRVMRVTEVDVDVEKLKLAKMK